MAFFMTLETLKIKSRIKQLRLLDVVGTCHIVQSFPAEFLSLDTASLPGTTKSTMTLSL